MECHASREQEEEDGGGELLARAQEDIAVVAKLLIWLSRSKTFGSSPPLTELSAPPPRRTRTAAAPPRMPPPEEKEEDKRASPTTPLSWSGRSAASGALCDDGWSASSPRPKRRQKTTAHLRGDPILLPRSSPRSAAAFRSNKVVASSPSSQDVVMAAAAADGPRTPSKAPAIVEPFRLRSTCPSSVGDRRLGKKKTVMELRAMKDSLLQEQAELRKELARQEEIYGVLLEENSSLKKLEPSRPALKVAGRTPSPVDPGEVNGERTQPGPASEHGGARGPRPTPPLPAASFPFDLNRSPDDEM